MCPHAPATSLFATAHGSPQSDSDIVPGEDPNNRIRRMIDCGPLFDIVGWQQYVVGPIRAAVLLLQLRCRFDCLREALVADLHLDVRSASNGPGDHEIRASAVDDV